MLRVRIGQAQLLKRFLVHGIHARVRCKSNDLLAQTITNEAQAAVTAWASELSSNEIANV
jgi:hypothetical protein